MRLILFLILSSWFLPFQILAVIGFMARLKKATAAGITGTAHKPLDARLILHAAAARPDTAAAALAPHLPHYSPFLVWAFSTFGLASRWSGYRWAWTRFPPERPSSLYSFIPHRTHFLDQQLEWALKA